MASIFYKWLIIFSAAFSGFHHPVFVSVTEINYNAAGKTLEISCKIFTDDFEKTLRATYKTHVDLLDENLKPAMDKLVNDYVQKHLKVAVDGKLVGLKYLGFEKIDEGIYSYYQADNITTPKKIEVTDNVLLEYNEQQMNIVHIIVDGKRKSAKLSGSENKVTAQY